MSDHYTVRYMVGYDGDVWMDFTVDRHVLWRDEPSIVRAMAESRSPRRVRAVYEMAMDGQWHKREYRFPTPRGAIAASIGPASTTDINYEVWPR